MPYKLQIKSPAGMSEFNCHTYETDASGLAFRHVLAEGEPTQYIFIPLHAFEAVIATEIELEKS
jgi:hypothetical protein